MTAPARDAALEAEWLPAEVLAIAERLPAPRAAARSEKARLRRAPGPWRPCRPARRAERDESLVPDRDPGLASWRRAIARAGGFAILEERP